MARVLIVGGFLALLFWVFSIVDCAVQPASRHRGAPKAAWIAIVALIPVLGGILWFILGRRRRSDQESVHRTAPDDDPEFLRSLNKTDQDARIRQLEEELARLDDETDGPAPDERS